MPIGAAVTRDAISARFGGGRRTCLPTRDGMVVAACLLRSFNPQAPRVILCGVGAQNGPAGERLASQAAAIPVFIKEAPNRWISHGRFHVTASATKGHRFDAALEASSRPITNVSRAIFLAPVAAEA